MKIFIVYFFIFYGFSIARFEDNITEIVTEPDSTTEYDIVLSNVTEAAVNETETDNDDEEDQPVALALRLGPPLTIYRHKIRVSRRRRRPRPRPKHRSKFPPRPSYGPPSFAPSKPIHFDSYPSIGSHESDGPSHGPSHSYERPDTSHSAFDVSTDFGIQSIPSFKDYGHGGGHGGGKGSYEDAQDVSYDDGYGSYEPETYRPPKPTTKKKHKKKQHYQPYPDYPEFSQGHDAPSFSYEPPVKSVETFSHDSEELSYSYKPKTKQPFSQNDGPSYSYESKFKSHGSHDEGPSYSYEPQEKPHISQYDRPSYTYDPPDEPEISHGGGSHGGGSHDAGSQGGYSYNSKPSAHHDSGSYSYKPKQTSPKQEAPSYPYPSATYKPFDTYGPPPQPPSSSYGYPISSGFDKRPSYKEPEEPPADYHFPKIPLSPSAPSDLHDLPSPSYTPYNDNLYNKAPTNDYLPPDTTYSFTTNQNSYNSLPTDDYTNKGHFAEPPPGYKNNGLTTSHLPLDHDHLSSSYGSPKSSYQVPIYDAAPFTTPAQDYYPPNLPSAYEPSEFQAIATGSKKVEITVPQNVTRTFHRLAGRRVPSNKRYNIKTTTLPTLSVSIEDLVEPSSDYVEHVVNLHLPKIKKKSKPGLHRNTISRHNLDTEDLAHAFSTASTNRLHKNSQSSNNSTRNWLADQGISENYNKPKSTITIEKSHSHSFYAGTAPPSIILPGPDGRKKHNGFHSRQDTSEISIKSPTILVSDRRNPNGSHQPHRGTVFDERLDVNRSKKYWDEKSLPPNHKFE